MFSALLLVLAAVELTATQPPADELLNDEMFAAAVAELEQSPRVQTQVIGETHEGRPVVMIIVAEPGVIADLDAHRARAQRIANPSIRRRSLAAIDIRGRNADVLLDGAKLPVMVAGASWGNEASQVEGIVDAARTLAFEDSEEVRHALSGAIALLIPLMNPDGRARAIQEWQQTPLSNGDSGIGNAYGFLLNRDFMHGTQPEARAVIDATLEWRPVVLIDQHEDRYNLGVQLAQVCFVEPFEPGFDIEEHAMTRAAVTRVGRAIAERWSDLGFNCLFDEQGDRQFAPLPEPGQGINPVASSAGRLNLLGTTHGIASFITESARTPGSQSWEDRVKQKSSSVIAALLAVSGDPGFFARSVIERRLEEVRAGEGRFVVVPEAGQSREAIERLLSVMKLHRISVFRVTAPYPALVVPLAQAEANAVRHFLLGERSRLNELPPALGLTIRDSEKLPAAEREVFLRAVLSRVESGASETVITDPALPRVAVYSGQGVPRQESGEIVWAFERGGFPVSRLNQDDFSLEGFKVLVMPNGSAAVIRDGWDDDRASLGPWQLPSQPRGLGDAGLKRIREFVNAGGVYIGIGGGARFAADGYLALTDVVMPAAAPGLGQVGIRPVASESSLLAGFPRGKPIPAFQYAPPGVEPYGYVFGRSDAAIAVYDGARDYPPEMSFTSTQVLSPQAGHAAIVHERRGRGHVVLFGIAPAFRGQWSSTFRLLYNAARIGN